MEPQDQQEQKQNEAVKPNLVAAFSAYRKKMKETKGMAAQALKALNADAVQIYSELEAREKGKIEAVKKEKDDSIAASLLIVKEKAQKLEEAQKILNQARIELAAAQEGHKEAVITLSQNCNRAIWDIQNSMAEEKGVAYRARVAAIVEQMAKVKAEQITGRAVVAAEAKAFVHRVIPTMAAAFKQAHDKGGAPAPESPAGGQKPPQSPKT